MELDSAAFEQSQSQLQTLTSSVTASDHVAHIAGTCSKDFCTNNDGILEECWSKFVNFYTQISVDYKATMNENLWNLLQCPVKINILY